MSLYQHAVTELKAMGMLDSDDEMNTAMSANILELISVFAEQGHSGFSASYCIDKFTKLANYKPLSPLTGADDEWIDVSEYGDGRILYQNKRCSSVFKDENGAWDIDGKVLWEWARDEFGEPYKMYYSNSDCKVSVNFPYIKPNTPIYEYCQPDFENGDVEYQDETGFL